MPSPLDALRSMDPNYPDWRVTSSTKIKPGTALFSPEEMADQPGIAPGSISHGAYPPEELGYLLKDRLRSEAQDRLFRAQRGGDQRESAALQGLIDRYGEDIQNDPITAQHEEDVQLERAGKAAQMAGFQGNNGGYSGAITAQNLYNRKQAETRLNQPVELQNLKNTGEIEKQRLDNAGGVEKQELVNKGNADAAQSRYQALQNLISGGGIGAGGSVAIAGAGSFRSPNEHQMPPQLLSTLATARQNYEARHDPVTKAALDQAIASGLAMHPAPQHLKEWVHGMLLDPSEANMTLDQALQKNGESVTPDEHAVMEELLSMFRGH